MSETKLKPSQTLGAGAVVQVVQGTYATAVTNSGTSFADTGLSASITPKSTNNKILVMVMHNQPRSSNGNNGINIKLVRGTTDLIQISFGYSITNTSGQFSPATINYLDSPATTSSVTYKTQFSNIFGSHSVVMQNGNTTSTIILMEIAG